MLRYIISYHYVLYCIVLYCIALHCIALHCIALHCIALHCIALHCIALYCIVLYCTVLYCIVLYGFVFDYSALHYIMISYIKGVAFWLGTVGFGNSGSEGSSRFWGSGISGSVSGSGVGSLKVSLQELRVFRVWGSGSRFEERAEDLGLGHSRGSGFEVQGLGFRVWDLGFRVWGLGWGFRDFVNPAVVVPLLLFKGLGVYDLSSPFIFHLIMLQPHSGNEDKGTLLPSR